MQTTTQEIQAILHSLKEQYKKDSYLPKLIDIETVPLQPLDQYYAPISLIQGQERKPIDLADLFEPLNSLVLPSKILITAPAGSGKSSLIQKIAFDWAHDRFAVGRFDVLIKVPLKHILSDWKSDYEAAEKRQNLFSCFINFIINEDADTALLTLDEQIHLFNNKDRVLLLIDGYDEIAPLAYSNSDVKKILKAIKSFPNYIITSRPNAIKNS